MSEITKTFVDYYKEHKRDLPWRETNDAYKIWISEIMLQQTRVEAVRGYYERFITTLPTLADLAIVDDDVLMNLWEGLGYYSRARNLKKCALICMEDYGGQLPKTYEELLKLPGIGKYTAGAIASIAYHQKKSAVDGNAMRIFARLFDIHDNVLQEKTKNAFINLIDPYVDEEEPGYFNQALMDYANEICTPTPKCENCSLATICKAYKNKTTDVVPNRSKDMKRKEENHTIVIVHHKDYLLLSKRNAHGLLANLYEFVNIAGYVDEGYLKKFLHTKNVHFLGNIDNKFSHITWHMNVYECEVDDMSLPGIWINENELSSYSIPSVMKKCWKFKK